MGRTLAQWDRQEGAGWWTNPLRKRRHDGKELTLVRSQVIDLVHKIDTFQPYTRFGAIRYKDEEEKKSKEARRAEIDRQIKMRDKGLLAIAWTFVKRGGEYLKLQVKDVSITDLELKVHYSIEKKVKRRLICPNCKEPNRLKAKYCSECTTEIKGLEPTIISAPSPREVVKTVKRVVPDPEHPEKLKPTSPLLHYFIEWVEEVKRLNPGNPEAYLFARVKAQSERFNFNAHISTQRQNQILHKLDPSLTGHMFRYGHSEELAMLGFKDIEIKEAGDWEKIDMPALYAKKAIGAEAEKKFANEWRGL